MFEYLMALFGRLRTYGLLGGRVSLGLNFEVLKVHIILSSHCSLALSVSLSVHLSASCL